MAAYWLRNLSNPQPWAVHGSFDTAFTCIKAPNQSLVPPRGRSGRRHDGPGSSISCALTVRQAAPDKLRRRPQLRYGSLVAALDPAMEMLPCGASPEPPRTRLLLEGTGVRRKSWGMRHGQPVSDVGRRCPFASHTVPPPTCLRSSV